MSLADRMDKIIKVEAEMLLRLELQRNQAEDILLDQRGLRISAQVTRRFLDKLEAAALNYEQASPNSSSLKRWIVTRERLIPIN